MASQMLGYQGGPDAEGSTSRDRLIDNLIINAAAGNCLMSAALVRWGLFLVALKMTFHNWTSKSYPSLNQTSSYFRHTWELETERNAAQRLPPF